MTSRQLMIRRCASWLIPCAMASISALSAPALATSENAFNPAEFDALLNSEHFSRAPGHELTAQKIVSAVEDVSRGKVFVYGYTQVLDCKRPDLLSMTKCDPCEYPLNEWVRRPLDVWFVEKVWHRGSSVMRARALRRMAHYENYFFIEPMEGVEHRGMVHQFWRFDGRRAAPLEVRLPPPPEPPPGIDAEPPKEWDKIVDIEIRFGDSHPERITTPVGELSARLSARAYTETDRGRRLTDDFWPFWSSDCGAFSVQSGQAAKETVFRLSGGVDTCVVHLYEARTGERRKIEVERGQRPPPPVRVAITFEGGREGDGVVLSGSGRWVDLEAHAYNPEGEKILGFTPEWGVDGGRVEYLNDSQTRLRVHVEQGRTQATVHARHSQSGAEDTFEIKIAE